MRQRQRQTDHARHLRREMTPTERALWYHLRGRRFSGWKFRRQTPIPGHFSDVDCPTSSIILELDGASHVGKEGADSNRQRVLEDAGFKVLRLWDTEIYDNLDGVLEHIWRECAARGASPPSPLPRGERG